MNEENIWPGKERRSMNCLDHDLLIEIKKDTEHLKNSLSKHIEVYEDKVNSLDSKIAWLQKGAFMVLGALALIKVFLK